MRLRFVAGPRGNYHMTELLSGLCDAARDAGFDAEMTVKGFPPAHPGTVCIAIPHEFYGCEPPTAWPSVEQRARTLALFVENPFTQWFEHSAELAPYFAGVVAINRASVTALRDRGIRADHLQLGYLEQWDAWHGQTGERAIDVTYLGARDPRRDRYLAGFGRFLWPYRTSFLVPVLTAKPAPRSDYLVDARKFDHLSHAKILLNLHRDGSSSFEWVRVLQAMANGCVVISEPALDHGPLVPGEHFLAAAPESMPHLVEGLLGDPDRLARLRLNAYTFIRQALPMSAAAERLVALAQPLLGLPAAPVPRVGPAPADEPAPARDQPVADRMAPFTAAVRNLTTDVIELRRTVGRLAAQAAGTTVGGSPEIVCETSSFDASRPRVTVAITLYNYQHEVLEALRSVAASWYEEYDVLVLDDASSDGSVAAVRQFADEHPWLPLRLLHHPVNHGLGAARNTLAHAARGEFLFVLDADNEIYPSALGRLVDALDSDPGATFAYPLLAVTAGPRAVDLLSRHAWDPGLFRSGNYIDAMALIRVDDLRALGGYTEDTRLTAWEDFELWCRCAASGRYGRHVPEVLARYRQSAHSMLGWTQTDASAAWSLMRARYPSLLDPAA